MIGAAPDYFALAADRFLAPMRRWAPERHQRPPAGDWDYWLLMAGRGSGTLAKPTTGSLLAPCPYLT